MIWHNKYLLYRPDLISHGYHFPAAHSGTTLLMSCSILFSLGCLYLPWCASSKAPTLLPMSFSGSGLSMQKETMVQFFRVNSVLVFPPLCTHKGILWIKPGNNLASSPNSWGKWYVEPNRQKTPLRMNKLSQRCSFSSCGTQFASMLHHFLPGDKGPI